MGAGDVMCQFLEQRSILSDRLPPTTSSPIGGPASTSAMMSTSNYTLNAERTQKMWVIGTFVTGPLSHVWQMTLEALLPGSTMVRIVQKTCAASTFAFFVSLPVMFTASVLLTKPPKDGSRSDYTMQDVKVKIEQDLVNTWLVGACYWPMVSMFVFRVVPVHQRAIVSSLFGTVWNVYLSFKAQLASEEGQGLEGEEGHVMVHVEGEEGHVHVT